MVQAYSRDLAMFHSFTHIEKETFKTSSRYWIQNPYLKKTQNFQINL